MIYNLQSASKSKSLFVANIKGKNTTGATLYEKCRKNTHSKDLYTFCIWCIL